MLLFAILGIEPAQNMAKNKRWLSVLKQLTNRSIAVMLFMRSLTKDWQGQGSFNINPLKRGGGGGGLLKFQASSFNILVVVWASIALIL